ncbi:hypothetical protein [Nocardia arthritidis]|uniref:Lipoprotein n=1 Tax=Nocardia arthritidis TaxID=228602 RepID=A0A6G9YI24_9NOCA|nr:hypothetical protein [Nocardia arthritidis]QIS12686.1 hypothetical protein F5544_24145 [Nocardia arthritidis]
MRLAGALAALMAIVVGMTGCGGEHRDADQRTRTPAVTDIVREAAEFGGIVIPQGVTVLDARSERGIDTLYQLALSTDQQGLTLLLTASKFSAQLNKVYRVTETTIAGPPLDTSPSILQADDVYRNPDGQSVHRVVTVDERDPSNRYVHIQLYDT